MTRPQLRIRFFLAFQSAVAGRYSIDRELGRGGMGIVYLAHECAPRSPGRDQAVAHQSVLLTRTLRERFLREATARAQAVTPEHHPDPLGRRVGSSSCITSWRLSDGETLAERVRTRGPLTGTDGARVLP
jgi:serine/threonine-protein kinase